MYTQQILFYVFKTSGILIYIFIPNENVQLFAFLKQKKKMIVYIGKVPRNSQ